MSREYKTSGWQRVYGWAMDADNHEAETHRRPPADRLFCRGDGAHAARPDMAAGERAHFAEHFARDFAAALSETRAQEQAQEQVAG
jgi:hypothetical protein